MAADPTQERSGFSALLNDLSDGDVVIEAGAHGSSSSPEGNSIQLLKDAVETSYRALAGPVGIKLDTVAVVEEVAKRSASLWVRAQARGGSGKDGLGEGADPSLLKFLARGTLAIIAWMDGSPTLQLADLQQAIRVLAWGTSITTSAHPALPSSAELVNAIAAWQHAKNAMSAGDSVRIVTNNGSADLDLSKRIAEPRKLLLARKLVNRSADMIFVVERPDYQASGEWQLKHGEIRTTAIAEPGTLLDKFYKRELDIRPGDALRCKVDFETSYGPDHEVLAELYRIVEIVEVLPAAAPQNESPDVRSAPAPVSEHAQQLEPAS